MLVIAAGLGGYWAGLRSGVKLAEGSRSVEMGAVAVEELTLLETGHPDKARLFLEVGVDDGLIGWGDLTSVRSRLSEAVFGSGLPPFDDERMVRLLARYRKAHPSPWAVPAGAAEMVALDPGADQLLNWRALKERDSTIVAIVERYAK
ncbi:MAG: hypothetical protein JSR73_19320 [Proteobacteria bacterium]|nr:hypothetical protein [Pseudomonadota bacterium]